MKIFADESVDGPIVYRLRIDGHEVEYVAEMAPVESPPFQPISQKNPQFQEVGSPGALILRYCPIMLA